MYARYESEELEFLLGADFEASLSEVADGSFFSALNHETNIYFLRHGQSEGNARMTYQGRLDYPLDETGIAQAQDAAQWFSDKAVDVLVSSPQKRASMTAQIIARECGLASVDFQPSLVEVDVGIFSGIDVETAKTTHPEIFQEFYHKSWDAVPGAESSKSMYSRAIASWKHLRDCAEQGARTIICVTHGGLIQWLVRATLGVHTWLPLIPSSNCGISQYVIQPIAVNKPAFVQWAMINFKAPSLRKEVKPVF